MLINLLKREFSSSYLLQTKGIHKLARLAINLAWYAILIAFELEIYILFYNKVNVYTNVNKAVISLLFFAFCIAEIIFLTNKVQKDIYNLKNERIIILSHPISVLKVYLSKCIYLYFLALIFNLGTFIPIGFCFAILNKLTFSFYILLLIGCLFISLICLFISLIITIPIREVFIQLKRQPYFLFIIVIGLTFGLAYIYSYILDGFILLVRNANLDSIFSINNVNIFVNITNNLYPGSNLFFFASLNNSGVHFGYLLLISILAFLISIPSYFYYQHFLLNSYNYPTIIYSKYANKKPTSIRLALIKKELTLSFSNQNGVFSYSSLISVQPFLIYLIVSSINAIFSTGDLTFIQSLFPNIYASIDTIIILLFVAVINSTSAISLSKEKNNVIKLKTFPVSFKRQIRYKLFVPYVISAISFFITCLVLYLNNEIKLSAMFIIFAIGLLELLILNITSIIFDLKTKKSNFIMSLINFILPIVFVLVSALITFLPGIDDEVSDYYFYLSLAGLELLTAIISFIYFTLNAEKLFIKYEGDNK